MNHGQSGICLTRLNATKVGSKKTATLCQIFLGESLGRAQSANAVPEIVLMRNGHSPNVSHVHYFIHTLIRTLARFEVPTFLGVMPVSSTELARLSLSNQ